MSGSEKFSCGWEGMNPEILALILVRIPADEVVRAVGLVCKSWLEAVAGPYCWTEIDLDKWCRRCNSSDLTDSAVRKLVRRSKCTFQRLSAYRLGNPAFSFVANCGRFLKVLEIPMSEITDQMVVRHAESLANVTVLDISYCLKVTYKGLEAFGMQCKSLIHLRRNMPPQEWGWPTFVTGPNIDDREAMIIADTMMGLHHLELGFGLFGDSGLNAILNKCKLLNHLDIRGCWRVGYEGDLKEKCERLVVLTSSWDDDYDAEESSSNDGSSHVSEESSSADFD